MMRLHCFASFAFAALLVAAPARAEVKIAFDSGRVTLDARDASLREILTQWETVGETRILNVDKLSAAPLTLRLDNVPERQALDMLLRALPGYVVAGQRAHGPSMFTRVVILAVSNVAPAPPPQAAVIGTPSRRGGTPPGLRLLEPEEMPVPLMDPRKELPADPDQEEEATEEESQPAPTTSSIPGVIPGAPGRR